MFACVGGKKKPHKKQPPPPRPKSVVIVSSGSSDSNTSGDKPRIALSTIDTTPPPAPPVRRRQRSLTMGDASGVEFAAAVSRTAFNNSRYPTPRTPNSVVGASSSRSAPSDLLSECQSTIDMPSSGGRRYLEDDITDKPVQTVSAAVLPETQQEALRGSSSIDSMLKRTLTEL